MDPVIIAVIVVIVLVVLAIFLHFVPMGLWISALASGVHVSIGSLVGMRIRRIQPAKLIYPLIKANKAGLNRIQPAKLIYPLIKANKAGLNLTVSQLETHYLAGGNVDRVINALIAAQRANIQMPFEKACAIDLAGRDVFQAVQMSVTPKVIETPVVAAIAKDGIELRAKARVTVRTNIERLVGGAGEETVIARVGEGIVTTVGSAETHKQVLENPDLISRTVLDKGLDAGTAYAREQEMKASVQEMRAKVVEAEAEVPRAMASALRDGKMGVLDYYQMKNTIADTEMRESIAKASTPQQSEAAPHTKK